MQRAYTLTNPREKPLNLLMGGLETCYLCNLNNYWYNSHTQYNASHQVLAEDSMSLPEGPDTISCLWAAIAAGHAEHASRLLIDNRNLANAMHDNVPALLYAAAHNSVPVITALLDCGAYIHATNPITGASALIVAICAGHEAVALALIEANIQVDILDKNGHDARFYCPKDNTTILTAIDTHSTNTFFNAIYNRNLPVVYQALAQGMSPDAIDKYLTPAIVAATRTVDITLVCALIARQANLSALDLDGNSALHVAIGNTNHLSRKALLKGIATQDQAIQEQILNQENATGETPLYLATFQGDATAFHEFIAAGAQLCPTNRTGKSFLMAAVLSDNMEIVETIVRTITAPRTTEDAIILDIDEANADGTTALIVAAQRPTDALSILINAGARLDSRETNTPFFNALDYAAVSDNVAAVQQILESHYVTEPMRITAFFYALAGTMHVDIITTFLNHGCDVNATQDDASALMFVLKHPDFNIAERIAQTLKDRGADIDARDANDNTVLLRAAWKHPDVRMVKKLLELKPNAYAINSTGMTALLLACTRSDDAAHEIVTILLHFAPDLINKTDYNGRSALHYAAQFTNDTKLLNVLKEHYACFDKQDAQGITPLMLAAQYNQNKDITSTLLSYTADPNMCTTDTYQCTALMRSASTQPNPAVIQVLLQDTRINADTLDSRGQNALMYAATSNCHIDVYQTIKEHQLTKDIDALAIKDQEGNNLLHCAVFNSNQMVIQDLRRYGASITIDDQNNHGDSPLMVAVKEELLHSVEALLAHSNDMHNPTASLKTCNSTNRRTPTLLAAWHNKNPYIIRHLLTRENDQNHVYDIDSQGNTPLHAAATRGNLAIATEILKYIDKKDIQACIDTKNHLNLTSMRLAVEADSVPVAQLLLPYTKEANCLLLAAILALRPGIDDTDYDRNSFYTLAPESPSGEDVSFVLPADPLLSRDSLNGNDFEFFSDDDVSSDTEAKSEKNDIFLDCAESTTRSFAQFRQWHCSVEMLRLLLTHHTASLHFADPQDGMTPLMAAAKTGHLNAVQYFFEQSIHIPPGVSFDRDARNHRNETALILALKSSATLEMIKALTIAIAENSTSTMTHGDINGNDTEGNTPLYLACLLDDPGALCHLLSLNANPNSTQNAEKSPLWAAVIAQKLDFVLPLLASDADIYAVKKNGKDLITPYAEKHCIPEIVDLLKAHELSLLRTAIQCQDISAIKRIHEENNKVDLNSLIVTNDSNRMPIWMASITAENFQHMDALRYCLSHDANINSLQTNGETGLMLAIREARHTEAKMLLDHQNIDINIQVQTTGQTAVMLACAKNDTQMLQLLIEHGGINWTLATSEGYTVLAQIVMQNAPTLVATLLTAGAPSNWMSATGESLLHLAINHWANWEIFVHLTTLGNPRLAVDIRGAQQRTALMHAVQHKNPIYLGPLVDLGADIDAVDADGNTALMLACQQENRNIALIQEILACYPNTRIKNTMNLTAADILTPDIRRLLENYERDAVFHAISTNNIALLEKLLRSGVDVNIKNQQGIPALTFAARLRSNTTIETILSHNPNLLTTNDRRLANIRRHTVFHDGETQHEHLDRLRAYQIQTLVTAIEAQDLPLVRAILEEGANVNAVFQYNEAQASLLATAIFAWDAVYIREHTERTRPPNTSTNFEALHRQAQAIIDALFYYGANFDLQFRNNMTAIEFAAVFLNNQPIVNALNRHNPRQPSFAQMNAHWIFPIIPTLGLLVPLLYLVPPVWLLSAIIGVSFPLYLFLSWAQRQFFPPPPRMAVFCSQIQYDYQTRAANSRRQLAPVSESIVTAVAPSTIVETETERLDEFIIVPNSHHDSPVFPTELKTAIADDPIVLDFHETIKDLTLEIEGADPRAVDFLKNPEELDDTPTFIQSTPRSTPRSTQASPIVSLDRHFTSELAQIVSGP